MDGLKTTRVLVIDDDVEQARPFMEALAKWSIGTIYFSGTDQDTLPPENNKLTGIRLAALDLDLGVPGEAPAVIDVLIRVLDKLLHQNNGPYLAIARTSQDDTYFREFQKRMSELACPPINVIKMGKDKYKEIDVIFDRVKESMEEAYPLGVLSFWEKTIHESSGSVMQMLPVTADLRWTEQSQQTLRLILDAVSVANDSSSSVGETPVGSLSALLTAFSSLQLDSIENDIASLLWEDASSLISPLYGVKIPTDSKLKAKLNYKLLFTEADKNFAPGNIYQCSDICPSATALFPTLDDLLEDMIKARENSVRKENKKKMKSEGCVPITMEITPLCDYQQNKSKLLRFVCGVALPYEQKCLSKKPEGFLRTDNSPIAFEDYPLTGTKLLVWNSRYVVSAPKAMVNTDARLVRLRQAPLVDTQAWLASQLNRPGYLSLRAPW